MLASSPVNSLPLPQLKRKRSNSTDLLDAPVATKPRPDDHPTTPAAASTVADPAPTVWRQGDAPATRPVSVDHLRETLEAQLSLEVLLKHNELRLIDQEIAKCQVALEQLRRCAEIPYPGVSHPSSAVSSGSGLAVWAPGNGPAPLSPAPWGVVDGPYTRHYSRWLLPDPRFDGGEVDPSTPLAMGAGTPLVEGRSTRGNSHTDFGSLAGKSRPQRGSAGARLQSLPSGYPAPKERAGPMVIRRKSDGVLVKLVCIDCRRDNFSSTQGFINHCRIAHNRNYASHDAAAVASGEPVEVDDTGAVIGGSTKSEATPAASTTSNPTTTATIPGFVHPLVRSAHVIDSAASSSRTPASSAAPSSGHATPKRPAARRPASSVETPRAAPSRNNDAFTGSPATPHLSSLMQVRGMGVDLDRLVGEAKNPVDLSAYSDDEEGESDVNPTPSSAIPTQHHPGEKPAGRQPMRTTVSQTASQRPGSRKGTGPEAGPPLSLETSAPYVSPYGPPTAPASAPRTRDEPVASDGMERSLNLSPNTVESNQAPSLVSDDDDDYGAASDSDSPGPGSSEAGDAEEDFRHIDVEDGEEKATPSASLSKCSKKKDGLLTASIVPLNRGKDEKRVSFAKDANSKDKDDTPDPTDPQTITPDTFRQLLARYPQTVEAVARRKASQPARRKHAVPRSEAEIQTAVTQYLELDKWRYEELPGVVRSRAGGEYLSREEVERLVEWKMKHGKARPTLLGMVRSNPEKTTRKATADAYRAVATADEHARWMDFPRTAMDALTAPLRGVGPATASLLLAVGPGDHPFYSDDTYLWLCAEAPRGAMVRSNGELNVKYNLCEYEGLWRQVRELQERLVREGCGQDEVSGEKVEKVALVWRVEHEEAMEKEMEMERLREEKTTTAQKRKRDEKAQSGRGKKKSRD
ncbi:hypothetical protein BDV59DRAFT_196487 [Aspergillus ambiguus]|uniref:uncharacterized protein n=1 Tax=Aspergillus ambiguus TaxID=176160 RepID=UPI003CCCBC1F